MAALPIVNAAINAISSVLRGTRAVSAAMSGAPTTTPSAYAETTCPAVGSEIPRPGAISGQQAHRHELGGADPEATERERDHGELADGRMLGDDTEVLGADGGGSAHRRTFD